MHYTQTSYVDIHDADFNGIARSSCVLRYMQSSAWEHMRALGPSGKELQDRGQAFIVSAMDMTIHAPVKTYQTLTAETWACKPRAMIFPRAYRLIDADGRVLAEAASQWALVDLETRALLRPADLGGDYGAEEDTLRITRFRVPKAEEMELAGHYTVIYSETDYIGHLNNTHYPDMFTCFLPMRGKRVAHICIHFLNEAPLGDKLTIYRQKQEGDTYLMLSVRRDGQINADAEITLVDIEEE